MLGGKVVPKCIIIALTYDDNIFFMHTHEKLVLPCLNILSEVNQKTLIMEFEHLTTYTTSRKFTLLGEIENKQDKYYVYAVIDAFPNNGKYIPISKICYMLDKGVIEDEKTKKALTLLMANIFKQKNFDKEIIQKDIEAKRRLSKIQNTLLTDEDKNYIKQYYLGRQQFMAFYSDFNLSRLMSILLQAKNGTLLEPSCGSGRLFEYLDRENIKITCYEIDPKSSMVCHILYPEVNVICDDALENLEQVEGKFDYSLCSPPWGLYVGKLRNYDLTSKLEGEDSTFYFTELMIRSLKHGGRGVILLPTSIFQTKQYNRFCELLTEWGEILLRVDLPGECCSTSNIIIDSTILVFVRKYNIINDKKFAYVRISQEEWAEFILEKSEELPEKLLGYLN